MPPRPKFVEVRPDVPDPPRPTLYGSIEAEGPGRWRLIVYGDGAREIARVVGGWDYVCVGLAAAGLATPSVPEACLVREDRNGGQGSFIRQKPTGGHAKRFR